jgi:hypothetical protein
LSFASADTLKLILPWLGLPFGIWNTVQQNRSIIKKEILAIISYIHKFQNDLLNQEFLVCVHCKDEKDVLQKKC